MLRDVRRPQTLFSLGPALPVILLGLGHGRVWRWHRNAFSRYARFQQGVRSINGRKVFPIGFFSGAAHQRSNAGGSGRDAGVSGCRRAAVQDDSNQQLEQPGHGRPAGGAGLGLSTRHVLLGEPARDPPIFRRRTRTKPATLHECGGHLSKSPPAQSGLWANQDEAWWGRHFGGRPAGAATTLVKQEGYQSPGFAESCAARNGCRPAALQRRGRHAIRSTCYPVVASGVASNPPIANTQISPGRRLDARSWNRSPTGRSRYWLIEQIAFSGHGPASQDADLSNVPTIAIHGLPGDRQPARAVMG